MFQYNLHGRPATQQASPEYNMLLPLSFQVPSEPCITVSTPQKVIESVYVAIELTLFTPRVAAAFFEPLDFGISICSIIYYCWFNSFAIATV